MQVTYTRRMGQHPEGSTVDMSDSEGTWLVRHGYATLVLSTQDTPMPTPDTDRGNDAHGPRQGAPRGTPPRRKG